MFKKRILTAILPFPVIALVGLTSGASLAQQVSNSPGVTDVEIRIGNIMPYSGPGSSYGLIGKTEEAYFKKINDEGGINGRKITFISYDDAYSPPKTVEQARKLVESDEVLVIFSSLGTATNSAIQKYLNTKKVPQLFVAGGATKWNNPKSFPWTIGWMPSYNSEVIIYAKYILKEKPDAKIAIFYQNDDYGKDFLAGLKEGLGEKASMIVAQESYETTEPSIDAHIVKIRASNADVLVNAASPKFAAQAIRKMAEIGWKPVHLLNNVSNSLAGTIVPAGIENAQGIISSAYMKDPTDPQWKDDSDLKAWDDFLGKYLPQANRADASVLFGYLEAQTLVHVLKACGNDLSRENVMRQATNLRNLRLGGLLPGITINTSDTDFAPLSQLQLMRFSGTTWERFGDVLNSKNPK